jgi:glycosyltransferase involved in cell wall biosynthesis
VTHGGDGRVLHVGKYYPPYQGGMENFLKDLLKALEQEGLSVSALVHHHIAGRPFSREEDGGVPVWRAPSSGQMLYLPVSPQFPISLRRVIKTFQPDLLHLHFPNPSACWGLLIPEARAIPWVIQWQSDVVPSSIDRRLKAAYRLYRPLEQAMLRRARRVIVASTPYLKYSEPLQKWTSKCRVIPLGIDPGRLPWPGDHLLKEAQESWRPGGGLKVLAVGRLTYYKGFDVLIRAAQRVPGITVQIVGDGALKGALEAQIAKAGVSQRVVLRGSLPDDVLQALMATCDLLSLSSVERTEAFGIVLLEAMRYGKALAVSDIPGSGAGWVVRKGSCGFLTRPGDAVALGDLFMRLVSEPEVCEQVGRRGKESLGQVFHIRSVARQINDMYGELGIEELKN